MTTLLHNCTALLMDEAGSILEKAWVLVEGTQITSVGTGRPQGPFDQEIDCRGNVLMPGLVNAHTHIPMSLLRGYGGGCDLHTWLHDYIFPAEAKMDGRTVRAGAQLALAELIASGVTTIADMYDYCDEIAQEVAKSGISANISRGMTLFSEDFDPNTHAGILEMKALYETWHGYGEGQIRVDACIHGEYTSKPALWAAAADFAREKNIGMHVHISETGAEHMASVKRNGKTPIQTLDEYGVWDTRAIAAHCVWTTPVDWDLMASKGVAAIHNPISNLKLGSGIARIPEMRKAGVGIGLGTDGVASNNSHDLFEEIKVTALIHSGVSGDPTALAPMDVLRMATCDGAKALGRKTGQIKAGYTADLILLNFSNMSLTPCHSVVDNLVYSARGSDVIMNMARGQIIYKDGACLTLDLEACRREVNGYALPRLFG